VLYISDRRRIYIAVKRQVNGTQMRRIRRIFTDLLWIYPCLDLSVLIRKIRVIRVQLTQVSSLHLNRISRQMA
jgi:hypothetical protein